MRLQSWSKWAAVGCLLIWIALVAVYITLAGVRHEVLPAPYNTMIMLVLSTATAASGAAWLAARIEARLDRIERRMNAHFMRISNRLDELETPTSQLPRPRAHLVVAGTAAVGTAVVPSLPADVLEIGRRIARKLQEG